MDGLTTRFTETIERCPEYREALRIVKLNSRGKIWLIGDFVCRTLAHLQYGTPRPTVDLDFIVERQTLSLILPEGWVEERNRFGNHKFVNDVQQIDYVSLNNSYVLRTKGLEPTIDNYLACTPLSIQAIVFDTDEKELRGERGLDALRRKVVEMLDRDRALYGAEKKGKSLRDYIQEKADSLGFSPVFPSE